MKNSSFMFLTMVMVSLMMVASSTNMISMWMSLEINMMMFIPLMNENNSSQSMMMYFLIQSMASLIFMMSILNMMKMNMNMMMTLSMFMKMGMPPFHQWFPEVMMKVNWGMCFMLMTIQKIPPMVIMSNVMNNSYLSNLIIISSIGLSTAFSLNQTSLRKLMAYSSMSHSGWMLMCMKMSSKSWIIYMMLYMAMMMVMCMFLNKMNIFYMNQMNMQFMTSSNKKILIMNMLSLGGMPPLLGFLPKWITIQLMIKSEEMFLMMIMLFMSVISMFYYLRMVSSISLTMNICQKWMNWESPNMVMIMYATTMIMPSSIFMMKLM